MADNKKTKTVNYRLCVAEPPSGQIASAFNLQTLIKDVFAEQSGKVARPLFGTDRVQVMTDLYPKQGCTCGKMLRYERGKKVALVSLEENGKVWEGVIDPVDSEGKKRELEEQALFFAVKNNHLAVIQTRDLSIKDFGDYLTWLIQTLGRKADGWLFLLQNLPSQQALTSMRDHKIKKVSVGKSAFSVQKHELTKEEKLERNTRKKYRKEVTIDGMFKTFWDYIGESETILEDLEGSDSPGSMYMEIAFSYKSKTETDSQELMKALAATVGGHEELDPKILLDGDSKISGDQLTIRDKIQVQCPSGIVSTDDAMTRLAEWLNNGIRSGTIPL